jgi:predicted transcriptional regulator of viral defense system
MRDSAASILGRTPVLRMSDALKAGVNRKQLYSLLEAGQIERLSRGLYRVASAPALSEPDLIAVASRVPKGVICLISALSFHRLTTQVPHAVDVAIRRGQPVPRIDYPPTNVYQFSGNAARRGIETHVIDGVKVRIYSPEKCVADIFKYRNKLGLDVAIEALKLWQARKGSSVDRLLEAARHCRVENVMRPYLEALLNSRI